MRQLTDVINQLLSVSTNEELNQALREIRNSCAYTAPEAMYIRWDETHGTLYEYTPNPINDEMIKLFSIFSTRPEEELREYFASLEEE